MEEKDKSERKARIRKKINEIKPYRCRLVIAVIENPKNMLNIGTIIRNVNALGIEKTYIVDPKHALPDDWQEMRENDSLSGASVSGIKWSFVKRFDSTQDCLDHLKKNNYTSIVTSPHIKGSKNVILHEGDYTVYPKLAVWFGNESQGISDLAVKNSELCVNLPMFGMVESLNLGTSSGIVLYEIAKQRREYKRKYTHRNQKGRKFIA
jgi:tRNA (guanosine-2'-O-)-methyltransferase